MPRRIDNVPLGVYVDKDTVLHRLSPSVKMAAVLAFIVCSTFFIRSLTVGLIAVAFATALFALARIPLKVALNQLWPPLLILLPLTAFQWWSKDFDFAAVKFLSIFSAMMLAFLLTLTSTVNEILESVESSLQPLARWGVPVETITLAISLTIRLIPLMFQTAYEVLDARKARGAAFSPAAFGTPVIIRSIRRARGIGEALAARGVGD